MATTAAVNTAKALVDSLSDRLSADRVTQFRTFVHVGELAELAYGLIGTLRKHGLAVTSAERDLLRDLLHSFDLPMPSYPLLSNRDQYLAELTVRDDPNL
ncbi:hypothetical protein [Saccharopolyspora sp. 6V]|uniref:hypothetical protein n=1 Tax=Saccharopolyspora sp. 6V TaxID=2877239 RepID=UPI001CD3C7C2|nr:hypothetical protein [Saccharopolyspora sp. 6V]MCA1191222.1 hypothetical protein [Saccharopolyspora sp. 6V]